MNPKQTRRIHRAAGIFFGVFVLAASGSGILHTVMSRTQAPPPKALPSGKIDPSAIRVPIADAVRRLPESGLKFDAVSVRQIGGQVWYQFLDRERKASVCQCGHGRL